MAFVIFSWYNSMYNQKVGLYLGQDTTRTIFKWLTLFYWKSNFIMNYKKSFFALFLEKSIVLFRKIVKSKFLHLQWNLLQHSWNIPMPEKIILNLNLINSQFLNVTQIKVGRIRHVLRLSFYSQQDMFCILNTVT